MHARLHVAIRRRKSVPCVDGQIQLAVLLEQHRCDTAPECERVAVRAKDCMPANTLEQRAPIRRQRIAREQVLRGVLEKRECFVQTFSAERLTEQLEMTAHETLQRSLEERSQAGRRARSYDRMQPLIAFGEQVAQERYDAIDAIAEMLDQHFELTCDSRILAQPLDEPAPGELVERTRIVGRLERRARACEHRQAARQRGVQRVDRLDAQTRWMLDQTPSVARIRIAYRLRELPGLALVRRCRRRTAGCIHGLQNATSHLRR